MAVTGPPAGCSGWSVRRSAGVGVGVASLTMRGLVTDPRALFVLPAGAV